MHGHIDIVHKAVAVMVYNHIHVHVAHWLFRVSISLDTVSSGLYQARVWFPYDD